MIPAPFSAADASAMLGSLATIFIALGGVSMMLVGLRTYTKRALGIGIVLAAMAGFAPAIFA